MLDIGSRAAFAATARVENFGMMHESGSSTIRNTSCKRTVPKIVRDGWPDSDITAFDGLAAAACITPARSI